MAKAPTEDKEVMKGAPEKSKGNPFAKKEDKGSEKKANPFAKKGAEDKGSPFAKKGEDVKAKDGKAPPFAKKGEAVAKEPEVVEPENKGKVKVEFNPTVQEAVKEAFDSINEEHDEELFEEFMEEYAPLVEDLSLAARMKKRLTMKRFKSKMLQKKQRAMGRRASEKEIGNRTKRSAINMFKKRFAGGRDPEHLANSDKNRIERMVKARRKVIDRISKRMIRGARIKERTRLQSK